MATVCDEGASSDASVSTIADDISSVCGMLCILQLQTEERLFLRPQSMIAANYTILTAE
jgi:hypothetical protein